MTNDLNIQDALTAYFKQPDGPSRPGIDFAIRVEGDHPVTVMVRTYFSSDPPQALEQGMMAARAILFLRGKLAAGWPPTEGFLELTEEAFRNMETKPKYAMDQLNQLSREEFVSIVGPVFEHSPWIADAASVKRPFADLEQLRAAMMAIVNDSGEAKQVQLIQAHPDLVGRAALAGTLTSESNREQASAGLGQLSPEEIALFQKNNQAYHDKFGFPFVICARLNKKEAILKGFETRLKNSRETEIKTALEEIGKIAQLRLQNLIAV